MIGCVDTCEREVMRRSDVTCACVDFTMIEERAKAQGTTKDAMKEAFAQKHIAAISSLGYALSDKAKQCLDAMLQRFFICDVGPAPFSVHAIEDLAIEKHEEVYVTVAQHCLQLATHWLRNPPEHFETLELEEFIVLSLFHDVYYYDDFTHHDIRPVEQLQPFLRYKRPIEVVGGHLSLKPEPKKLSGMQFDSPQDALKQEWVQLDWFLTMVSNKKNFRKLKPALDDVTLPLEFFYHIIGSVMGGDELVIARRSKWRDSE